MLRLFLESYLLLIRVDVLMCWRTLPAIYSLVRDQSIVQGSRETLSSIEAICHAMNLASVFYIKPVHCLQHSSATTIQLRRYGWNAEMIIGVQMLPFASHAWAEINEQVVNDKPYVREMYIILDRC